jgi:hypothetical protein
MFQVLTQSMMDWPELVLDPNAPLGVEGEEARQIANHMTQIQGMEAVLYHLSLVAAGMADRPRRPDRDTIFRPFSSRDAHVLLQLKRTKWTLWRRRATNASISSWNMPYVPARRHGIHKKFRCWKCCATMGRAISKNIRPKRPRNCRNKWQR